MRVCFYVCVHLCYICKSFYNKHMPIALHITLLHFTPFVSMPTFQHFNSSTPTASLPETPPPPPMPPWPWWARWKARIINSLQLFAVRQSVNVLIYIQCLHTYIQTYICMYTYVEGSLTMNKHNVICELYIYISYVYAIVRKYLCICKGNMNAVRQVCLHLR